MQAIVAVDKKWGIGKKNGLLFNLPADMQYFKQLTYGKVVVMGSNTLKSFPNGNPLKNRVNIVFFPNGDKRNDCIVLDTFEEVLSEIKKYPPNDVFIIGGAMFYKTMLPYCEKAYVTKVEADGEAEVFFENLDALSQWECVNEEKEIQTNGYNIRFTVYKNNDVLKY